MDYTDIGSDDTCGGRRLSEGHNSSIYCLLDDVMDTYTPPRDLM